MQLETPGLPPACSPPTVSLPASPCCAHAHTNPTGRLCWGFCSWHLCPDPPKTQPSPTSCLCSLMPCLGPQHLQEPRLLTPRPQPLSWSLHSSPASRCSKVLRGGAWGSRMSAGPLPSHLDGAESEALLELSPEVWGCLLRPLLPSLAGTSLSQRPGHRRR